MVYETALFQLAKGTTENEALQHLESLNPLVSQLPGFISRHISHNGQGQWLDFLEWESMEQAKAASDKLMQMPEAAEAFGVIDMGTLQMFHFHAVSSTQ
ncbi:MAG: hypothetical protein MUC87_17180 [Bacteroidia bacterium]|jgi:heme-degrading monooxygenase HmoA|nr:hypothetical protein [Bacteroidia bacterium]